jgi:hypothetical protein
MSVPVADDFVACFSYAVVTLMCHELVEHHYSLEYIYLPAAFFRSKCKLTYNLMPLHPYPNALDIFLTDTSLLTPRTRYFCERCTACCTSCLVLQRRRESCASR